MKKARKSFTFWFALVGIIGVILNVTGFNDVRLFIGFNPILNVLSGSKACCDVINSVSHLWYILSMITMIVYGLVIDALKSLIRKKMMVRFSFNRIDEVGSADIHQVFSLFINMD